MGRLRKQEVRDRQADEHRHLAGGRDSRVRPGLGGVEPADDDHIHVLQHRQRHERPERGYRVAPESVPGPHPLAAGPPATPIRGHGSGARQFMPAMRAQGRTPTGVFSGTQHTDNQPKARAVDSESGEHQGNGNDDSANALKYEVAGELLVGTTRLQ